LVPGFIDDLFLAFTNATAFSPTDTIPLTVRAKLLMMMESVISLRSRLPNGSADNHPIHYDVEYARRQGHFAPVVHGLQVFAFTAPGATLFPQYIGDVFIAFTSASCKFPKGVHTGDTLYPALEMAQLTRCQPSFLMETLVTTTSPEQNKAIVLKAFDTRRVGSRRSLISNLRLA
jgi:acyl dehydratase